MGAHLDPRIKEGCDLLDAAQRLERFYPGNYHAGTFQWRLAEAARLRARAAELRREVHGR